MEMAVMFYPFHSLCDYLSTVTGFEVDKVWPTTCTRGHLSAAMYCKTAPMLLTNTRFTRTFHKYVYRVKRGKMEHNSRLQFCRRTVSKL